MLEKLCECIIYTFGDNWIATYIHQTTPGIVRNKFVNREKVTKPIDAQIHVYMYNKFINA